MKKKRFYNNKKRDTKWTEETKGRKIAFADKYTEDFAGTNKFDNTRPTQKEKLFSQNNIQKMLRTVIIVIVAFGIMNVGYAVMDLHLERNAMPVVQEDDDSNKGVGAVALKVKARAIDPLSLDGSIMLDATIDTSLGEGFSSVAFDLKRSDGTIGYASQLATINAYGAISSPAGDIEGSVKRLVENDILPIGIISCYKDNIVPREDKSAGLTVKGKLYEDREGSTYLNPKSQEAYSYIKSLIDESRSFGITVFALTNYQLPQELGDNLGDGFDAISKRLKNDYGDDIKILKAEEIEINAKGLKAIEKEIKEKTEGLSDDTVLFVTAENESRVQRILDNSSFNYILQGNAYD